MALALPLAIPWISLDEVDPAGHLELLAWVALVPALFALDRARTFRGALAVGLAAGLAYFYAAIWWVNHAMTSFGGVPFAGALGALSLLVLYMAAHWALALAVGWLIRRRLGTPWALHLPLVWTALEWSRNYLFTGFPWANLGYTQARHPHVAQLAAVAGVYGVAALVVLVNGAVHAVLESRLSGRRFPARVAGVAVAAVAAALAFGHLHLREVRSRMAAAPRITVGLVQGNIDQSVKNRRLDNADYILGRFVPLTVEADRRGADLVAWPEATYPFSVPPRLASFERAPGMAPLSRAHLLVGASTWEPRGAAKGGRRDGLASNSVFLVAPSLEVLGRYSKHHLVPFGEYVPDWLPFVREVVPVVGRQVPGGELSVLSFATSARRRREALPEAEERTPTATSSTVPAEPSQSRDPAPERDERARGSTATSTGTSTPDPTPTSTPLSPPPSPAVGPVHLAPLICFDAIFPEITRAFVRRHPEPTLLLNPTNDAWYGYSSGPYQFLAIVRMRAIEAGKAIARPAFAGVTAVILPTGEVAPGALPLGPVDPDLAPDREEPPRLLLAEVPLLRGSTLYTRFGDLFAGVATVLSIAGVGLALRRGASRGS
jgi:apolipoprotein N-acyltransferase